MIMRESVSKVARNPAENARKCGGACRWAHVIPQKTPKSAGLCGGVICAYTSSGDEEHYTLKQEELFSYSPDEGIGSIILASPLQYSACL